MEDPTSLVGLLTEIKDVLDRLVKAVAVYHESRAAQQKEEVEAKSKAVVRLPIEVTTYYETENREKGPSNKREKIRLGLECVAVGAAIGLAILTFCTLNTLNNQLVQMRRSNDLTKTQWEAEYRPWMGMDTIALSALKFSSQRPSLISVHLDGTMVLKNFGTYPAFSSEAEITPVIPFPTDAWTKNPLGRPPEGMFRCSDETKQAGEIVFPGRGFTSPFSSDLNWGWRGNSVEVGRLWLLVCISYRDGRAEKSHHTKIWLRSAHPINAQWIAINSTSRYMPITGFESWGEETDQDRPNPN